MNKRVQDEITLSQRTKVQRGEKQSVYRVRSEARRVDRKFREYRDFQGFCLILSRSELFERRNAKVRNRKGELLGINATINCLNLKSQEAAALLLTPAGLSRDLLLLLTCPSSTRIRSRAFCVRVSLDG